MRYAEFSFFFPFLFFFQEMPLFWMSDLSLFSSSQAGATGMQQETCRDTGIVTRYGLNDNAPLLWLFPIAC